MILLNSSWQQAMNQGTHASITSPPPPGHPCTPSNPTPSPSLVSQSIPPKNPSTPPLQTQHSRTISSQSQPNPSSPSTQNTLAKQVCKSDPTVVSSCPQAGTVSDASPAQPHSDI